MEVLLRKMDLSFLKKNSLVTLLFTPIHKCFDPAKVDTRKKSDKVFQVQFKSAKVSQGKG